MSDAQTATAGTPDAAVCDLPDEGELSTGDLPAGSSVIGCGAVGRVVTYDGTGVTVPEPGTAVSISALAPDGSTHGFTLEVAADGKVSYDLGGADADSSTAGSDVPDVLSNAAATAADLSHESDSTDADAPDTTATGETEVADADSSAAADACSDGAYSTDDRKEYGTYEWWIGDGGMPGSLSREDAREAFWDAIDNITGSSNNCGYSDQVPAKHHYRAPTSFEADINSRTQCTDRDTLSTWDAGDLGSGVVAATCSWTWPMPGVKNDLREADVRFNTADYDFTNKPTSRCSNKYDIRSVGTHEAGHVFGLGHVGSGHQNLTMYTNSFTCTTKARTLGKGDVMGLRSIY
ncbi:matrixin family metalloprotease [Streptomyces sp. NBC_01142]|uniref:matrixin family metalloprotease n=1 Tax=Streptomyces sp. NBC_01142 TaxID=2975865 RepID=UPI0022550C74|nr:matrixin family metalloprotease [Streptomyces sp. NBC_01142]MCX4821881.1 matrixin family metalloprotease [Streptomyces sp. NBC_01142]